MEWIFKYNQDKTTAVYCGIDDRNYNSEVIIPQIYDGAMVVSVSSAAFSKSCISLVHIPNTVKTIGM